MTPAQRPLSAGLLLYRFSSGRVEVMLVHMGGPFWARRDRGAWSIPKGEPAPGELPALAALREFEEETGLAAPPGDALDLGTVRQASGKLVHAWALEADLDVGRITSNMFELEWPKGSGSVRAYPEVDRAAWFDLPAARTRIVKGQVPLLDALERLLRGARQP